jgi:pSer/pThr/pTyr-binding forkhead associated (FHA) protein
MKFQLLVVCGEPRGKFLPFPPGEFIIGRGQECHLRPIYDSVSRQHCLLKVTRNGAVIRDLGSTNGTLVNGLRLTGERNLLDGDRLQLGPLVFEAKLEESIFIPKKATTQIAPPGAAMDEDDKIADLGKLGGTPGLGKTASPTAPTPPPPTT